MALKRDFTTGYLQAVVQCEKCTELGTLLHVKNMYRHVNMKDDVHQCFNEATDLLRFTTTTYIIATALSIMGCKSHSEVPSDFPTDIQGMNKYVYTIADKIAEVTFKQPNSSAVLNSDVSAKPGYAFCICRNAIGGTMIECGNNKCKMGKWFHLSCLSLNEQTTDKSREWFCSLQCKGVSNKSEKDDLVFEYSRLLMNRGIKEMARHRAIRHNNGNMIILHWKEDMFDFYEHNHTKYFLCGHQILMDTQGALSERLAHQLRWNRTVNVKGGEANNLEMDLQMEFFNREFKDSLKDAGGNISEKTMARHGEMVGVSRQLGGILDQICSFSGPTSNRSGHKNFKKDIHDLVDQLLKKKYCQKLNVARFHPGFENVQLNTLTCRVNPVQMKRRITKHVKKRSRTLRIINARA